MAREEKINDFKALLKKAEGKIRYENIPLQKLKKEDILKTVHELHVHQTELEMQNEQLRQAQQELEESRHKFSDLFEFAPTGYFIIDKKGNILQVNMTGSSMLGTERSFLVNKLFGLCVRKEDRDIFYLMRQEVLHTKNTKRGDLRMVNKSVGEFFAELLMEPVTDTKGNVNQIRIAVVDISARKEAEAKLREAEQKLALAAAGTNFGIFDRDIATGRIDATRQNVQMLGLRTTTTTTLSQHYHYRDWARQVHSEDLPRVEAQMARSMKEHTPFESEYRVVWPDGSMHWIAAHAIVQYDGESRPQ